ncbi:MAG TPA: hypothetical protein VFP58_10865 [Candidatus Eisenbacteria bacterium]|nr:hypothetical protein [Candidatus Eisenbacteria bacterium]
MSNKLWGGPARTAGPRFILRAAFGGTLLILACLAPASARALDWIPPAHVTAVLPGATLARNSTHQLQMVVLSRGAPANLSFTASAQGQFPMLVSPATGNLTVPANSSGAVTFNVTVPDTALGISALSVTLTNELGGGQVATVSAAITAATDGRPEIKPVPGTFLAAAGTSGSVSYQIHSLIGATETITLTTGRSNPDPNNQGALFSGSAAPTTTTLPGAGTITVNVPTTIASNVFAGNRNAIQLTVTSDGGLSTAVGHAVASTTGSVPTALFPVGLTPGDGDVAGRDGAAHLASRGYWLVPSGLDGLRVIRDVSTDSIGPVDADGNGGDDRWIGTVRIPSYAASIEVIPGFARAPGDTVDVGLVAAGRGGLMLVDLSVLEDPSFGTWEDFFDVNFDGIDDRIVRIIPTNGFATDVAWFRAPSGRTVAFVADADTGSVPVLATYNPASVTSGTGQGVVAIDVGAALDVIGNPPFAAGTLATPGTALDLEVRGGASRDLVIADGASGVHVYGLSASGGTPATVTFTPRGTVSLSNTWGVPYARDVAWVRNTGDSLYAAVGASAGGVQLVRVPKQGGGSPSLVLVQQTLGPAMGLGSAWTGTIGAALGSSGVALLRAPGAAFLDRIAPGAGAPYTAPVTLARLASWAATGMTLEVAGHQTAMSAASAVRFEPTSGGPNPDLLLSDGSRVLVLRPGNAAITAVEVDAPRTPPATYFLQLRVSPNPATSGTVNFEVNAVPVEPQFTPSLRTRVLEVYDLQGRLVRRLRAEFAGTVGHATWDGRDEAGRRVASGRYWVRTSELYSRNFLSESFLLLK